MNVNPLNSILKNGLKWCILYYIYFTTVKKKKMLLLHPRSTQQDVDIKPKSF